MRAVLPKLRWQTAGKKSDEKPGVRVAAEDYLSEQALWIRGWLLGLDWLMRGLESNSVAMIDGIWEACQKKIR